MDVPVKVHVRIKPNDGLQHEQYPILERLSSTKIQLNHEKEFTFDHVFETDVCTQNEVFKQSALPLLKQLVLGYNVTIMAYGPTGSGKSYTLGTSHSEDNSENEGLLTSIVDWIFSWKINNTGNNLLKIKISFLEIYKEEIFDLLSPTLTKIELKNDKVENVIMENMTEITVDDQLNALAIIKSANSKRQVKKTKSNDSSSRSHAIITLILETNTNGEIQHSRIRLVDLAGSEAVAKDGVIGEIKNEGIFINKGLLALGKVINALNTKNVSHIPHRESILTRALKDSLSGNSLTNLICCVKSDVHSITTTSAALQFAAKARAIKTKVQPIAFKTPLKPVKTPTNFKTPSKTPLKTPGNTLWRTPLVPILRNKVVTPGGSSFALPQRVCINEPANDLDESIFVSGSYKSGGSKNPEVDDIENRIQTAVMERVDLFLEGFKDKLAQSLLANCSQHFTSSQSLLSESDVENQSKILSRYSRSETDVLNLTSALDFSQNTDSRRRSTRLAEKRMTLLNASTTINNSIAANRSSYSKNTKKASVLPLPTPEGRSKQQVSKYRKDMLHFLNNASQSQMQKLPSVGPKAGHSILSYRGLNGNFTDLENLKLVPGLRKNFYEMFIKVNFLE